MFGLYALLPVRWLEIMGSDEESLRKSLVRGIDWLPTQQGPLVIHIYKSTYLKTVF